MERRFHHNEGRAPAQARAWNHRSKSRSFLGNSLYDSTALRSVTWLYELTRRRGRGDGRAGMSSAAGISREERPAASSDPEAGELRSPLFPVGDEAGQQIVKRAPVMMMAEMAELVENHIVDAGRRKLGQPDIEHDPPVPGAAPPAPLHHPEGNRRPGEVVGRGDGKTGLQAFLKPAFTFGPEPGLFPAILRPHQPPAGQGLGPRPENPGRLSGHERQDRVRPGPGGGMDADLSVLPDLKAQTAAPAPNPKENDGLPAAGQAVARRRRKTRRPESSDHPGHLTRERAPVAIRRRS